MFLIYQASAGSGKTYNLVKEYLTLALRDIEAFRSILAITFTNKAAKEMKNRILKALGELSEGKNEILKKDLENRLKDTDIEENSKRLLKKILHNYSNFAVTTIDSFIHRIVKSFAFELNLPPYFELDLKEEILSLRLKDKLIEEVGRNKEVTEIFENFLDYYFLNGDTSVKSKLNYLSKNLVKQFFDELSPIRNEGLVHVTSEKYKEMMKTYNKKFKEAEQKSMEILSVLNDKEWNGKISNVNSLIKKFLKIKENITKSGFITSKMKELEFLKKAYRKEEEKLNSLGFYEKINDIKKIHYDILEIKTDMEKFFDMLLLKRMNDILYDYIKENDIVPISELNQRISKLIKKESASFIYYKTGDYYKDYLIDEFQDTSIKQWNNLHPLIENSQSEGNFGMVVGDPKQAIYRWRGGDVNIMNKDIIEQFARYDLRKIILEYNYRSGKNIVDFNNLFFEKLVEKYSFLEEYYQRHTQKNKIESEGMVYIEMVKAEAEENVKNIIADKMIDKIKDLVADEIFDYKDIAILVDRNREGEFIADKLFRAGIDVISADSLLIENEPVIHLMISAFNWLLYPDNILFSMKTAYFLSLVKEEKSQIEMLFRKLEKFRFLGNDDIDVFNLSKIKKELGRLKEKREFLLTLSLYDTVENLIKIFSLNKNIKKHGKFLERFLIAVIESKAENMFSFLSWWEENKNKISINSQEGIDAVRILTIHKSKGLEFPAVFIPFASWSTKLGRHDIWLSDEKGKKHLVKPKKDLCKTKYKQSYLKESNMTFIDSLNKLYVAFTRPKEALFVYGPVKFKKNGELTETHKNSVNGLLFDILFKKERKEDFIYKKGNLYTIKNNWQENIIDYDYIDDFIISNHKNNIEISLPEEGKERYVEKLNEDIELNGNHFKFIRRVIGEIKKKNCKNKFLRVVLPTKKSAVYFRALYKKIIGENVVAVSFDDFVMGEIKRKYGYGRAEFIDILIALMKINPGKIEDDFNYFFNLSKDINEDFNEIDANLVDVDDFFKFLADITEIDEKFMDLDDGIKQNHINSMKMLEDIYGRLNSDLKKERKLYLGGIYKMFFQDFHNFIGKNDYFIFAGFNKFTVSEFEIIKKLLKFNQAEIYFDVDDYYYSDPEHEAGILLKKYILDFDSENVYLLKSNMTDKDITIKVNSASSIISEVKAIGSLLEEMAESEKIKGNNTAVIVEKKEDLTKLVNSLPGNIKSYNISINFPMKETLIYGFIKALIRLHENNNNYGDYIYKKDFLNFVLHPYFKIIAKYENCDCNFMNMAEKQFIGYVKIKEILGENLYDNLIKKWKTMFDFINSVNFINDILLKITIETDFFKNRKNEITAVKHFENLSNAMNSYFDKYELILTPKSVWKLYDEYFASQRIPFDTSLLNGVQIMSLEDTRGLDFENVIFLSANEGVFPYGKTIETLIPFEERRKYGLSTYDLNESDNSYLFYRLIQNAEYVEIFYQDNINEKVEKSRYVEQLLLEYGAVNKNAVIEEHFLSMRAGKVNVSEIFVEKRKEITDKLKTYGFSPSLINTYRACSFKFYLDYIIGLNKFDKIDDISDPRYFGDVFHNIMEKLYKDERKINFDTVKKLYGKYEKLTKETAIEKFEEIEKGEGKLFYDILKKSVKNILDYDSKREFKVVALEKTLKRMYYFDETAILLKGKADRIEIFNDGNEEILKIVDYKTGSNSGEKYFVGDLNDDTGDKVFQLLHYAYCYNPDKLFQASDIFVVGKNNMEEYLITDKGNKISEETKEEVFYKFEKLLNKIFSEMFNLKVKFGNVPKNDRICEYCNYRDVCGKIS